MFDWTIIGVGIAIFLGLLTAWGSLWFKMGKVTTEVRGHNRRIDDLKEMVDSVKQDVNQRIDVGFDRLSRRITSLTAEVKSFCRKF